MSYSLEALIAPLEVLQPHAGDFPAGRVVTLEGGFALVPITEELFEQVWERTGSSEVDPFSEFWKLSWSIVQWAQRISENGRVAYVEADFFGGSGMQAAIVWREREVIYGPQKTFMECRAGRLGGPLLQERAINEALQVMGVPEPDESDEFDAIELGRFRATAEWLMPGL